jgi:hypothetical protein
MSPARPDYRWATRSKGLSLWHLSKEALLDIEERLLGLIADTNSRGCWLLDSSTYGMFRIGYVHRRTHIVAHALWVGPVPPKALVTHRCDMKPCICPTHLLLGTLRSNRKDFVERYTRGLLFTTNRDNL